MADRDVLEIDGADPLAPRLDDVLGAIDNLHEALGVERGDVAGGKPVVGIEDVSALSPEVAGGDPRPPHHELAEGYAVARHLVACVVDDLHLDAVEAAARLPLNVVALLGGQLRHPSLEGPHSTEGAHLGHAPGLNHANPVLLFECLNHRPRHRRAAADDPRHAVEGVAAVRQVVEQHKPHRRHTGAEGHPLAIDQLIHAGPIQPRARKHERASAHRHGIRKRPGVGVEHRHDGQHRVTAREPEHIRRAAGQGMDHGGAVAVERAFGIAGGARGIAQGRRRVLVESGPFVVG